MGISFEDGKYETNHNYMRSLWALLILMMVCSFVAQRRWASIFNNELLCALLKLPGYEKLNVVKRAQETKPYEKLNNLTSEQVNKLILKQDMKGKQDRASINMKEQKQHQLELVGLSKRKNQLLNVIEVLTGAENEHNHTLDYYPNQLIYLLMARKTAAYRMSNLRLRRKMISYSIWSFSLTLMQYILPWAFIGDKYKLYGFNYFKIWLKYTLRQLMKPRSTINSIDYELSSQIFPTSVACEYQQYGLQAPESATIQCTVSINEICSKLFMIIWWFVAINIIIELYSLACVAFCSINFATIRWCLSRNRWPQARQEAKRIATFRYRHATLLQEQLKDYNLNNLNNSTAQVKQAVGADKLEEKSSTDESTKKANQKVNTSNHEKKISEAEAEKCSSNRCLGSKNWYLGCCIDMGSFLSGQARKCARKMCSNSFCSSLTRQKWKTVKDEDGYREVEEDPNIYFLLYLLHLRLNNSNKKMERIIKMTNSALDRYLENLEELCNLNSRKENSTLNESQENVEKSLRKVIDDEEGESDASVDTIIDVVVS